jgi:DNA processing protein
LKDGKKTLNELEALLCLTMIPQIGPIKIRLLIHYFGSACEALKASASEIAELPGFGSKIIESWKKAKQHEIWRENFDLIEQLDVKVISYTDPRYPKRLLELADAPLILYVKGSLLPQDHRSLAVVGTRQATFYGLEMARKVSQELAELKFTVVSGLARGIDTAAHEGALTKGRTLAVIGSGLANIYPKENIILAEKIAEKGALISEFPMNTPPDRQTFPQRNRIVSGMTMGTTLIEAPEKSGAMLTVERAISQNRKVFVLPGRADVENFRGNHALLKQKKGELIENGADVARHFDTLFSSFSCSQTLVQIPLEKEEELLLQQMPNEEVSIEEVVNRTKLPITKLNVLLMSLVLKKYMKEYPGKIYKKISN